MTSAHANTDLNRVIIGGKAVRIVCESEGELPIQDVGGADGWVKFGSGDTAVSVVVEDAEFQAANLEGDA